MFFFYKKTEKHGFPTDVVQAQDTLIKKNRC